MTKQNDGKMFNLLTKLFNIKICLKYIFLFLTAPQCLFAVETQSSHNCILNVSAIKKDIV